MDKELAQMVANSAARIASELAELMPLIKKHIRSQKDQMIREAIATAVYEIGVITDLIFEEYPDMKPAAETRLEKYGRSYF